MMLIMIIIRGRPEDDVCFVRLRYVVLFAVTLSSCEILWRPEADREREGETAER